MATRQLHSKFIESASIQPGKLALIRNLNSKLGIQNSEQGFNVAEEAFMFVAPSIMEHVPDMEKLFNAESEDKSAAGNLIKRLDKVYKDWAGTGIVRNSQRVRITGTGRKQTLHTITKEHDQSVEDCVKSPEEEKKEKYKEDANKSVIIIDLPAMIQSSQHTLLPVEQPQTIQRQYCPVKLVD